MTLDPTKRFSDRVADYVAHRPGYPAAVVEHLESIGYLFEGARVADIGAGTGIFSRLLLDHGYDVVAVEPNAEMRAAAKAPSASNPRFHSIAAPAEATTLPGSSVDLVTAAQALHWFEPEPTRAEFARITRPPHRLAAIWNRRDTTSSEFLRGYEQLLQDRGIGYPALMESRDALETGMERYFGTGAHDVFLTRHAVRHDWDGVVGRLLSSSYGPKPGHPDHDEVMARLRALFDAATDDGTVEVIYETRVFCGEIRRL